MGVLLNKTIIEKRTRVDSISITFYRNTAKITYDEATLDSAGNVLRREYLEIPKDVAIPWLTGTLLPAKDIYDSLDGWRRGILNGESVESNTDVDITLL
jgi:hypothetical protein